MLDATLPELNSPPLASTIDAAKARDVDAARHRNLGAWCVVTVRVHSPAILTRCSVAPAEESPLRLRKVRDAHSRLKKTLTVEQASREPPERDFRASDRPAHNPHNPTAHPIALGETHT